jgi:hypothetical protein
MIVHTPFKNYYRLHGEGEGRIVKTDSSARFFITQRFVKSEFILGNYQLLHKDSFSLAISIPPRRPRRIGISLNYQLSSLFKTKYSFFLKKNRRTNNHQH